MRAEGEQSPHVSDELGKNHAFRRDRARVMAGMSDAMPETRAPVSTSNLLGHQLAKKARLRSCNLREIEPIEMGEKRFKSA